MHVYWLAGWVRLGKGGEGERTLELRRVERWDGLDGGSFDRLEDGGVLVVDVDAIRRCVLYLGSLMVLLILGIITFHERAIDIGR